MAKSSYLFNNKTLWPLPFFSVSFFTGRLMSEDEQNKDRQLLAHVMELHAAQCMHETYIDRQSNKEMLEAIVTKKGRAAGAAMDDGVHGGCVCGEALLAGECKKEIQGRNLGAGCCCLSLMLRCQYYLAIACLCWWQKEKLKGKWEAGRMAFLSLAFGGNCRAKGFSSSLSRSGPYMAVHSAMAWHTALWEGLRFNISHIQKRRRQQCWERALRRKEGQEGDESTQHTGNSSKSSSLQRIG
ncbi:hypothetical protein BX070DRAFT_38816 [Coemansia spiralis]|nr:hypothetical protein BX070DRAFT_38816 [Coemansia spiralis]